MILTPILFAMAVAATPVPEVCKPVDDVANQITEDYPDFDVTLLGPIQAQYYMKVLTGAGGPESPIAIEEIEALLLIEAPNAKKIYLGIVSHDGLICYHTLMPAELHKVIIRSAANG